MSGEIIGDNFEKVLIYNFFVHYFDNPILKKIKNVDNMSIYACKIQTQLVRDSKFLFVIANSTFLPTTLRLDEIYWTHLQTRTLTDEYKVLKHSYTQKPEQNIQTQVYKKDSKVYNYTCLKYPLLNISLLYGENQTRPYADRGTLKTAIENFNTVFSFEREK